MKKLKYGLIFIITFTTILILPMNVKGFYWIANYFETDKNTYFNDEQIKINSTWDMYYNPAIEVAYIQAQIYNNLDNLLWNSSERYEIGIVEEVWIVNINLLNLDFPLNTSYISLSVRLFAYYLHIDSSNTAFSFLETIEIQVTRKDVSCELIGFEDSLIFGNSLIFYARFFDSVTYLNLINKSVVLEIESNNITHFQGNYTTDIYKEVISLNLSTFEHLKIGVNHLLFTLEDDTIYNNAMFSYEVIVNKSLTFVDIIKFDEVFNSTENIEIILYYYYNDNTSLEYGKIKTVLINNFSIIYENIQSTDSLGLLNITIPSSFILNGSHENQSIAITFMFEGTSSLKDNTFTLNFIIEGIPKEIKTKTNQNSLFLIILVSILILGLVGMVLYFKKKKSISPGIVNPIIPDPTESNPAVSE